MINQTLNDADKKMVKAVDVTREEFAAIRAGRANPQMFSKLTAEYYGTPTPVQQLATFTAPEARIIIVAPFDVSALPHIEKAIRESDLGLNPSSQGDLIRVPMPPLTEERRRELTKVVKSAGEDAKVAIRNLRRDANEQAKKLLKDKLITEDDERRSQDEVQKLTDKTIIEVDKLVQSKEAEILAV